MDHATKNPITIRSESDPINLSGYVDLVKSGPNLLVDKAYVQLSFNKITQKVHSQGCVRPWHAAYWHIVFQALEAVVL